MKNKVILLSSDQLGQGDPGLGATVLETFFVLLKQKEELPEAIFCVNRGVFNLTDNSLVAVHLKEIADKGVPVLGCKTCIDFYGLEEKLYTGEVSSMGTFLELAAKHEVITIG